MKKITIATQSDIEAVNELRLAMYKNTKGFDAKPPAITWNRSDDQAVVLVAWEEDKAIGTLRLDLLKDREMVEYRLECPWDFEVPYQAPVALLGKMAVLKEHRKSGLNQSLRYHALRIAKEWGAAMASGTMVAASPRKPTMVRMGYTFFDHPVGWTSPFYKNNEPVLVVCLLREKFDQCMDVCLERCAENLKEFPFEGELPEPRFTEVKS